MRASGAETSAPGLASRELRCKRTRDQALTAIVTAPEIRYLAIEAERRSLRRGQPLGAGNASWQIAQTMVAQRDSFSRLSLHVAPPFVRPYLANANRFGIHIGESTTGGIEFSTGF